MDRFVHPNQSEAKQLQLLVGMIGDVAEFYQNNLINCQIEYESKNLKFVVQFASNNFAHLCGIQYRDGTNAFFNQAVRHQIKMNRILIKRDQSTFQKLQVLPALKLLLTSQVAIGGSGNMIRFRYDAMVRSHRKILSLHFQTDKEGLLFPVSMLNLRQEPREPRGEPVQHITIQHFDGTEEIVF